MISPSRWLYCVFAPKAVWLCWAPLAWSTGTGAEADSVPDDWLHDFLGGSCAYNDAGCFVHMKKRWLKKVTHLNREE